MEEQRPSVPEATVYAAEGRNASLRVWLSLVIGGVLVAVVASLAVIGWRGGSELLSEIGERVERHASVRVEQMLSTRLEAAMRLARLKVDSLEGGALDPRKTREVASWLLGLLRAFPEASYLSVAFDDGRFVGVGRAEANASDLIIEEVVFPDLQTVRSYRLLPDGSRAESLAERTVPGVRQQRWFADALSARTLTWTQRIGDGATVSVRAALAMRGVVRGVVGVDVLTSSLSEMLGSLEITPASRVFIVERDGSLVALSTRIPPYRVDDAGVAQRIQAVESEDATVRATAEWLLARAGGLADIAAPVHEIRTDGHRWHVGVTPWRDPRGLDWLIIATVPEQDFDGLVMPGLRHLGASAGLILLVALCVSLVAAAVVSQRLGRLERSARQIADGDLAVQVPASGFREFNHLADAVNRLAARLAEAMLRLENGQSELEHQVQERTAALRVANDELERLAREDGLTGLANRRHFDQHLREEWLRARRAHETLGVILCDVDFFKAYNDRYGHGPGDDALKQVAKALARNCRRAGDLAARYGGEEFALVLPGVDLPGALQVADGIREQIRELGISHEASPLGCLTMSFGVACQSPEASYASPDQIMKSADRALYEAKASGRDRAAAADVARSSG